MDSQHTPLDPLCVYVCMYVSVCGVCVYVCIYIYLLYQVKL